jgi:hypothetical protein
VIAVSADASFLLRRVDDLDAWWTRTHGPSVASGGISETWVGRDACDLALQIAEHLRDRIDLPALERRVESEVALDLEPLRTATRILKAAQYDLTMGNGAPFDPRERLGRLDDLSNMQPEKLDPLEVLLRLSMWGTRPSTGCCRA